MASKLENISGLLSNVKMRTVIIMTVVILLLVILIGFFSFRRNDAAIENAAQLSKARSLESVPGLNPTSPQYAQIQQQVNEQNYEAAKKGSGTAIPTVIHAGSLKAGTNPAEYEINAEEQAANEAEKNGTATDQNATAETSNKEGATSSQLKAMQEQQKAQMEAMQKKIDAMNSQQMQQELQQTQQSMQREAQQLMTAWTSNTTTPTQQYVQGTYKTASANKGTSSTTQAGDGTSGSNAQGNNKETSAPVIKAGTIYFGTLETAVNSDEPGPIMVKIATGTYKGARLIGSIQGAQQIPGTNGPDKLILNFTTMSIPSAPESVSVSAVAIDPDTARTALASNVNYHYLQRYGTLFGSAFLEGWGQAIAQAGSTTTTNLFGTTTTDYGKLSGIEEVYAGLGQVGQNWGQQMGDVFHRKPTVLINSGVSVGILFLSDVTLSNVVPPAGSQTPLTMPMLGAVPATASAMNMANTAMNTANSAVNTANNAVNTLAGQQPAMTGNSVPMTGNTLVPIPTR
jgi:type IV secretory pathway VirB10-like protein